jgi:hypothetical protein
VTTAVAVAFTAAWMPSSAAAVCGDGVVDQGTPGCVGDCNGDGSVTVDEIVTMVNIALGMANVSTCTAGDSDGSGSITVDEIITATNNALNGCPGAGAGDAEGEDCDDGGTCIGGDNAGMACTAESQCPGNGVCLSGTGTGRSCAADEDCPGSSCIRCKPFGGDGCAANCTNEKKIAFDLVPGVQQDLDLAPGTSGVVVFSDFLDIPLALSGSLALTVGEERNGEIPAIVKQEDIDFPAIPVLSLACACVKGTTPRTCGGIGFLDDGITLSPDCSDNPSVCTSEGLPPCAPLHGEGNTASGIIGCNGLDGTDINAVLDNGDLTVVLEGTVGPGSGLIFTSIDIGLVLGQCTGTGSEYGPDGAFCTADDPPNELSAVGTGPTTTGTACGQILNEFGGLGPHCRDGAPASCTAIADGAGSVSGTCLTFALPVEGLPQVGDIVATLTLCAQ